MRKFSMKGPFQQIFRENWKWLQTSGGQFLKLFYTKTFADKSLEGTLIFSFIAFVVFEFAVNPIAPEKENLFFGKQFYNVQGNWSW